MPPAAKGAGCKGKDLGQRLGWAKCAELRAAQTGWRRVKHKGKTRALVKAPSPLYRTDSKADCRAHGLCWGPSRYPRGSPGLPLL